MGPTLQVHVESCSILQIDQKDIFICPNWRLNERNIDGQNSLNTSEIGEKGNVLVPHGNDMNLLMYVRISLSMRGKSRIQLAFRLGVMCVRTYGRECRSTEPSRVLHSCFLFFPPTTWWSHKVRTAFAAWWADSASAAWWLHETWIACESFGWWINSSCGCHCCKLTRTWTMHCAISCTIATVQFQKQQDLPLNVDAFLATNLMHSILLIGD